MTRKGIAEARPRRPVALKRRDSLKDVDAVRGVVYTHRSRAYPARCLHTRGTHIDESLDWATRAASLPHRKSRELGRGAVCPLFFAFPDGPLLLPGTCISRARTRHHRSFHFPRHKTALSLLVFRRYLLRSERCVGDTVATGGRLQKQEER